MVATAAPSPERFPRWRRRWTSFRSRFLMRLRSLLMVALLVGRILAPNGPAIAQPQQQQQRQTASVESRAPAPVRERMAQGVDSFRTHLFTRQEPLDRSPSEDNGSGSGSRSGRSGGSAARTAASSTRRDLRADSVGGTLAATVPPTASAPSSAAHAPLATAMAPVAPSVDSAIGKIVAKTTHAINEARSHISPGERDTILLLLATALVTPAMGLINLSPVLGFLFAGMVLGPAGLAVVSDIETTTKLAELGVVFFLFEMGLELELERLKSVGRDAFFLGSSQFTLTWLVLGGLATYFGASAPTALILGGGLALSSSAFVIQLLSEKGELASRFGRASFGILLFQDLAVVPLLVVTPLLGGSGAQLGAALRLAAIKSVSALLSIFVVGRFMLQRAYKLVASAKDQTSFLAITLVTVLSMAGFTAGLGLSDTLGAFLAGVLLAETKYRYQIEADIAPFRGLLLGLFFITTGFSIDLGLAATSWKVVLAMAVGLHTIKTVITTLICLASNLKLSAALRSGLLLSQGGEFAFVIFALAQQHGLLAPRQVKLLLTTVVLTMFLTPFLNEIGAKISSSMERRSGKILLPSSEEAESSNYILVCGFGRVGQAVCELLTGKLVRYKAFDMDPYRVAEARELGLPVFFGDATRPEVLQVRTRYAHHPSLCLVLTLARSLTLMRPAPSCPGLYARG